MVVPPCELHLSVYRPPYETDEHAAITYLQQLRLQDALSLTGHHTHWWPLYQLPFSDQKVTRSLACSFVWL
jgi:hypothetical protein